MASRERRHAVIVDIDGVLAIKHHDRGYLDYELSGDDTPNQEIVTLLRRLAQTDVAVILITGREEWSREVFNDWFGKAVARSPGAYWNPDTATFAGGLMLFMRPNGDRTPTAEFKRGIYLNYIEPSYNVLFAIDDYAKCCDMFAALGIPVWRYNEHDYDEEASK